MSAHSQIDDLVKRTVSAGGHSRRLYLGPFQSIDRITAVSLAPLTFLVGPNSAGKSAVLDALRIMADGLKLSKLPGAEHSLVQASLRANESEWGKLLVGYGCTARWRWADEILNFEAGISSKTGLASELYGPHDDHPTALD